MTCISYNLELHMHPLAKLKQAVCEEHTLYYETQLPERLYRRFPHVSHVLHVLHPRPFRWILYFE